MRLPACSHAACLSPETPCLAIEIGEYRLTDLLETTVTLLIRRRIIALSFVAAIGREAMSKKILSIGYDRAALTLRNWVLERAGYEVLSAGTRSESLNLLAKQNCDLIVLAGSIRNADVLEIVSAANGKVPILWLFSSPREDLPGIAGYMPLLDGPEELLSNVRRLLAEPMHVASTREQTPMHHDRHGLTSAYLVFADSRRNLVEITPEACRLLGYERAELLRMTVDQITAKSDAPVPELFSKFVAEGFQEGSYTLKHRSGRQIPIRYRAKVFPDGCMAAEWFPFISAQKQQAKRRA